MKESKGVYVTKRTMKHDFQRACGQNNKMRVNQLLTGCQVKRYATTETGCQADAKKDLGCTCRMGGTKHPNERYFNAAEQVYAYHGLPSFTNTCVGSVRPLHRKRVQKVYLTETVDRGVGDSDLSSSFFRKPKCACGSYYGVKQTSSKCVGSLPNLSFLVVNVKLSPIVKCKCVTTGSEMPRSSEEKAIEISTQGTYTEDKKYIATTTQVQMTPTVADAPVDPISIPNAAKEVKEIPKEALKWRQRNKTLAAKVKAREEEKFSSDSLVQHIHDLECFSKISRPSEDPVMENKIEREYRQIFATKSKSNQDQPTPDNRSISLLRRRFEALRRGRKKDEPKNAVELVSSSPTSLASHKDVSIVSDPPSLEARSFSRPRPPYKAAAPPTYDRTSYRRSVTGKKDRDSILSIEHDNDINQGVSGMFRLWGKKFNLDDQKKTVITDDNSKIEESMDEITGVTEFPRTESKDVEKKTGGRKFSFFSKRSKDKTKSSYKSKKGVTTNRCEVKNGLLLKIAGTSNPQGSGGAETKKQPGPLSTEKYDETLRKAWLKKFLSSTIDSRDSVKIRWNNATYTTSSSTVFELMDNVYKHTGIVIRSKSDITTHKQKQSNNKRVNFIHQNIEAWMMPNTVPDRPILIPIKMKNTPDKGDTKSIEVSLLDQKWSIDTAKTFSHKLELVLHSNNVVQLTNKVSSDFLRIDIPKGFFSDSTTGDEQDHQCRTSDEEVFKIVEYEALKSNSDFRKKGNFDTGDHASNEITVTVKVKDSQNVESKVLETVIKRPSAQRDVVTQGSEVYFPKRCDVIGVGIIRQRDVREMKPILNIQDELSEDESDPQTYSPKKNCQFAQSYLQDYYRHLIPQGIDLFSWCIDDSNDRIGSSEKNSALILNHGDGSKSCPDLNEELNAAATEGAIDVATGVFSDMALNSPSGTKFHEELKTKSKILLGKFYNEKRPREQCAAFHTNTCEDNCNPTSTADEQKRVVPKDSVEVFRKRKIYAVSQKKSKWGSGSNSQGGSLPSLHCRKSGCKAVAKKQKPNSKHVIVTQPCPSPPDPCHSPPKEKASCSNNSYPKKKCQTREPVCQSSLPACPTSEPACPPSEPPSPPSEPPCPPSEPSCPHSEPPCPPSELSRLPNIQSNPSSKPRCPTSKPSCMACIQSYPPSDPPCLASIPLCPPNVLPLDLKQTSSHYSKDIPDYGYGSKSPPAIDTRRVNKITINTNAFEIDETMLKCNKPAFPILPCTSPPSLCATVTPVSPSEAGSTLSSNNPSKYNLIVRRCLTPPSPNVDPKMRSISPVTSLLNCENDDFFQNNKKKKRLCSMVGEKSKASENKKSSSLSCKCCVTPPCTLETDTTSSEKEDSAQTAPTLRVVSPSKSPCRCCPFSPPASFCQNDAPTSRVPPSYQSHAPGSYPRAKQPQNCPVVKISLPIANQPPSPPSCLPEASFLKQFISPPSFPLVRQFAVDRLISQPSLKPYHLSTNRMDSHPPCFTDRSVAKQSSSPCSLPADSQYIADQLVPRPSLPPYHPSTHRPISRPSFSLQTQTQLLSPPNSQFAANQLAFRPSSPPPEHPCKNQSVSPSSSLPNHLNYLPHNCQLSVNKLASRRFLLSRDRKASPVSFSSKCPFVKQQCTQLSPCLTHDGSTSYISLIRKSDISTSAPNEKQSVSLSPYLPSTPIPKNPSLPEVENSNQTDRPAEYLPVHQSSSAYISRVYKCCSQSALTDTTPMCMSTSSKHDSPVCSTTPSLTSPNRIQNIKSKLTGLFLRKLPSIKNTNARSECDDGKKYNIKVNEHCSDSHSGIREMKIQDEDGLTLCERTEYKKRSRSIHVASVVGDVYETANVCDRVSTNTSELKVNSNSKHCILPDESSPSLANLVEIQFKMKVTQGDKITEINIGNGGDSEKDKVTKLKPQPSRDVYVVNKTSGPVTVSNSPGNDIDIRIIIKNFKNKNKKMTRSRIKKESAIDEFTRKISEKLHTVSTGYSDIMHSDADPTVESSNAFSVHRATWDLTCESEDKEKSGKISHQLSDDTGKETTNINTNTSQSAMTLTESVIKDDEIPDEHVEDDKIPEKHEEDNKISYKHVEDDKVSEKHVEDDKISEIHVEEGKISEKHVEDDKIPETHVEDDEIPEIHVEDDEIPEIHVEDDEIPDIHVEDDEIPEVNVEGDEIQEKSRISVNLSVIKSDISKHGEPNVATEDTEQSTGVEIGIISSSDTMRREKTPKSEKKTMLKMVIEKAGRLKHKNKNKVSKITRMLRTILTSDSSDPDHVDMTVIENDLAKDITYASLPPNILRDTDSMNNFFKISSMMSDNEDKFDRFNTSRETVTSSNAEEPQAAKSCGRGRGACLCNQVAAKLGISSGGCCCKSREPQKADMETNCDIRTDEDIFLLNYGTSGFIDQETQRSRLFCTKANSVNVTFFKSVLSNELDIFNVSGIKKFSSNNIEKRSQEESKMVKKASFTPEALGNVLNLSDEDKIIIANMEPTKYKIETMYTEVTHRKQPKEKVKFNNAAPADILQSYATKKAVLEMYTDRTLSKGGERLVAKLPKFSLENESDIIKYEKICTRSLIFSLKR